jgi:Mg/Co/Ni transporter MgtE
MTALIKTLPLNDARNVLSSLPAAQIRSALSALPPTQLRAIAETSAAFDNINLVHKNLQKTLDSLPTRQLHDALRSLSTAQVRAALAAVAPDRLRSVIESQFQATALAAKPLKNLHGWLDSSFASSETLANLIDSPAEQSKEKKR